MGDMRCGKERGGGKAGEEQRCERGKERRESSRGGLV